VRYNISLVPPGGGEQEYIAVVEGERVPQLGEYIILEQRHEPGAHAFRVIYITTSLKELEGHGGHYAEDEIWVQAEFVEHPLAAPSHKQTIEEFAARGLKVPTYPESGY
jgi:hypothetical protein